MAAARAECPQAPSAGREVRAAGASSPFCVFRRMPRNPPATQKATSPPCPEAIRQDSLPFLICGHSCGEIHCKDMSLRAVLNTCFPYASSSKPLRQPALAPRADIQFAYRTFSEKTRSNVNDPLKQFAMPRRAKRFGSRSKSFWKLHLSRTRVLISEHVAFRHMAASLIYGRMPNPAGIRQRPRETKDLQAFAQ